MGKFKNPYTPEQVIAFSYSQLVDMKEKATRNQVFDLLDLVNSELEKRPPPPCESNGHNFHAMLF